MTDSYNYGYHLGENYTSVWLEALAYSDSECAAIKMCFLFGSIIGCTCHVFVLLILLHKMCKEETKFAADQLMVFLTFIDLVACGFVFPLEMDFFGYHCHGLESDLLYGMTVFLETLSTLTLQSIAINRALLIFFPRKTVLSYAKSWCLCLFNVILSFFMVVVIFLLQTFHVIFYIYAVFLLGNVFLIIFIYLLIFGKLFSRVGASKRKKKKSHRVRKTDSKIVNSCPEKVSGEMEKRDYDQEKAGSTNVSGNSTPAPQKSQLPTCSNTKSSNGRKDPVERMRDRAAFISATLTTVYIICFVPNGCLFLLVGIDKQMEWTPNFIKVSGKYLQMFYNLNFILMPAIYAGLSQQFRQDFCNFFNAVRTSALGRFVQRIPFSATDLSTEKKTIDRENDLQKNESAKKMMSDLLRIPGQAPAEIVNVEAHSSFNQSKDSNLSRCSTAQSKDTCQSSLCVSQLHEVVLHPCPDIQSSNNNLHSCPSIQSQEIDVHIISATQSAEPDEDFHSEDQLELANINFADVISLNNLVETNV